MRSEGRSLLPMVYLASLSLTSLAAGCAHVEVHRIKAADQDSAEGVRFYRPEPYLMLALADGGKGCVPSILWLPDKSQEYAISAKSGFGSVTVKPALTDGWNLTGFDGEADSKAAEMITAIGTLSGFKGGGGGGAADAAKSARTTGTVKLGIGEGKAKKALGPGLYRIVWPTSGGTPTLAAVFSDDDQACPGLAAAASAKPSPADSEGGAQRKDTKNTRHSPGQSNSIE